MQVSIFSAEKCTSTISSTLELIGVSKAMTPIDEKECQEYLADPWNPKYKLGLYFTAIHEITGPIYINIDTKIDGKIKSFQTLHSLHDGFDALKLLSRKENLNLKFKEYKILKPKNKLKTISLFFNSEKNKHQPIKRFNTEKTGYSCLQKTLIFDLKRSPALHTVLDIIAKITSKYFSDGNESRWMIPVRTSNDDGLQASFIGINVTQEDTPKTLRAKYFYKLKHGEYWGRYYLAKFGLLLGRRIITNLTKKELSKEDTAWLGSISHIGDIKGDSKLEELHAYAPARYHRPIAVALYTYNGRFYITLSIHNTLDKTLAEKAISEINDAVSSL